MTAICIAGMHRSGTSMVARLLNLCGVYLGEQQDIMPPMPDNPEGFWENVQFVRLNDQILSKLGGAWDVPPQYEAGWQDRDGIAALRETARELICQLDAQGHWGWKDPRNSLTLPFWLSLIPDLKVIICLRNPLEVARSLSRRGSSSTAFSLNLWRGYAQALQDTVPAERCLVSHYSSYFSDARAELDRILEFTGLVASPEMMEAALQTVLPDMRHGMATLDDLLRESPPPDVVAKYAWLCAESGPVYWGPRYQEALATLNVLRSTGKRESSDLTLLVRLAETAEARRLEVGRLSATARSAEQALQSASDELNEFRASRAWKMLQYLRRARMWMRDPFGRKAAATKRASPKAWIKQRVVRAGGWFAARPGARKIAKVFLPGRLRQRLMRIPADAGEMESLAEAASSEARSDVDRYNAFSSRIAEVKEVQIAALSPKALPLLSLQGRDLQEAARSLVFARPAQPEVSIIIPVYDQLELTLECLSTIKRHTPAGSFEIVIVDDGSGADTAHALAAMQGITVVTNAERLGYTKSCNKGAEAAHGRYLLFLNNDVQVTPGWLESLLATMASQPGVGAVGPRVLYPDGRLQEAGAHINRDGTITMVGLRDNPGLPRFAYDREVDYCSGVCLLLEAGTFRAVEGFDEGYAPAYYEDADLCLKLRARGLKILYSSKTVIIHHLSRTTGQISSDFKMSLIARNRQRLLERWQAAIDELNDVKLIAFYLPQYHPIPENNLWWGAGFTEWTNVTHAEPNYQGHYQPRLPADLGFYDLRLPDVHEQQVALARRYGIYGFCYYYYWFDGKRILEGPIERMLETGKPDFPFCLCWANENWSRRWDGSETDVLLAQNHSDEDDRAVIRDMVRYLRDPRYIRIDGKPLVLVYRVSLFPDFKRTAGIWREVCRQEGVGEIQLAMVQSFEFSLAPHDPRDYGMDSAVQFPPHNPITPVPLPGALTRSDFTGIVADYRKEALKYIERQTPAYQEYRTVMPGWDNTARRQSKPTIFEASSPGVYQAWLEAAIQLTYEQNAGDSRIVFINAWNEWAEGNYLEPDRRYGHRYLQATYNALQHWLLRKGC